jgi:hypothetical protein
MKRGKVLVATSGESLRMVKRMAGMIVAQRLVKSSRLSKMCWNSSTLMCAVRVDEKENGMVDGEVLVDVVKSPMRSGEVGSIIPDVLRASPTRVQEEKKGLM